MLEEIGSIFYFRKAIKKTQFHLIINNQSPYVQNKSSGVDDSFPYLFLNEFNAVFIFDIMNNFELDDLGIIFCRHNRDK